MSVKELITVPDDILRKKLRDINISARTGAVVIAIVRKNKPHPNPGPEFVVLAGDVFILLGSHVQLDQSLKILKHGYEDQKKKNIGKTNS